MTKNNFVFIYAFVILTITLLLATKPDYNWDMLPYMSIVQKMDGVKSFSTIHETTYKTAQQNLPEKNYSDLVNPHDKYRKKMKEDAVAFEMQLPFFDIKPIYLASVFLFYKIGVSLTYSTVLPSLIAYFFINLIALIWLKKFDLSFKVFVFVLFLIAAITIPLATRSNPDTLACLFLLISSFLFLETNNIFLCVLFLVFSILTRPENIIFSFLLFMIVLAGKWKQKIPLFASLSCFLFFAITYYLPVKMMGYPGWSSLFYHAFIDNTVDPSIKQTITISMYLKVVRENLLNIKGIAALAALIIISAFMLLSKNFNQHKNYLYKLFYIVVVVWTITKTLLFPMPGLRFVIPPVLFIIFTVVKVCESKFKKENLSVAMQ